MYQISKYIHIPLFRQLEKCEEHKSKHRVLLISPKLSNFGRDKIVLRYGMEHNTWVQNPYFKTFFSIFFILARYLAIFLLQQPLVQLYIYDNQLVP